MRQMVHLKLRGDYPAEIQEAAVIQDDAGRQCAWLKVTSPEGVREFSAPLGEQGEPDLSYVPAYFWSPAYHRLRRDLQQLARSLP